MQQQSANKRLDFEIARLKKLRIFVDHLLDAFNGHNNVAVLGTDTLTVCELCFLHVAIPSIDVLE